MNDDVLRALLAPALELAPTDEEVRRVLQLDSARFKRRRRRLWLGFATALAIAGVSAAPPTRAALDSALDSVAPWMNDDGGKAPGRALTPLDNVPDWLRAEPGDHRVLAEVGGVQMAASRNGDKFSIALGSGFGETGTLDEWREFFGDHAVLLLGPADAAPNQPFDAHGRQPLFGLAAKSVARVELIYASGPPTSVDKVDGAFGLLADATRTLEALVGYDRNGRQIERRILGGISLRICRDVRGCPPGHLEPRRR